LKNSNLIFCAPAGIMLIGVQIEKQMFNQNLKRMKKLVFAMLAFGASVVAVQAQDAPAPESATPSTSAVATQDDKVKIKAEELPEAVKKSLEAQEYKGWLINAAYHVKSTDSYEVELKNGAETKTFKFDKEGKKKED
jgi:hypothetical protein